MNRETRRLSKIPEQVRQEIEPFYLDRFAIADEKLDSEKIDKLTDTTAERIRSGLAVSVFHRFLVRFPAGNNSFTVLTLTSLFSQDGMTWMPTSTSTMSNT